MNAPKLYNLKYGHPFPMLDDDVVVMAESGLYEPVYVSWQIRIASYGLLVEHVCTRTPQGEVLQEHIVELPDGFVDTLLEQAVSLEFHSFPNSFESFIDLHPNYYWVIAIRSNGVLKMVNYDMSADREGLQGMMIERFMELWKLIHTHAPFPGESIPQRRSKRQLKMDARRLKRQKRSTDD